MARTVVSAAKAPRVAFPLALLAGVATVASIGGDGGAIAGIAAGSIVLWVLTPVAPAYTGILAIGAIAAALSPAAALTGFRSSATWLIGFGLLMGIATRRSGLADAAGRVLTRRALPSDGSVDARVVYRRFLVALSLAAHALALLIPSSLVRVLLLAPILSEIGERFDSRQARVGVYLGPLFATFYGSSGVLTADLPNIIISGLGESVAGHPIAWTEWLVHMYPVMGLTRVVVVVAVVYAMFRPPAGSAVDRSLDDGSAEGVAGDATGEAGIGPAASDAPTGRSPARMLAFLSVGVAVWLTDFLHGLDPVVGAIAVVALAFAPGVGVARFEEVGEELDVSILFFVAAVLAIGDGLAATGLSERAATTLLGTVPADAPLVVALALVFATTVLLAFAMEGLAVASVLTPVVITYAESAGLPLTPVLMIEALGLSNYFFPYQSAVLIAILAEGDVETSELIRTTAACTLATIAVLLPIHLGWMAALY
ncbi:sodium:sulfate symporter [Halorubrum salipaludis]|uniref:Sodium:sulfate symporter n=1 Tax=Halorubrum salipaludis TaxID=2032630 RepID=A0A2A2FDH8_9EURY|nr:SLC13 family permease [Halorubrum salipaludis]PAU83018.1 sodium:sulfate symporter [Halorubrum salipaludis]